MRMMQENQIAVRGHGAEMVPLGCCFPKPIEVAPDCPQSFGVTVAALRVEKHAY
jgi:hypothetical protein